MGKYLLFRLYGSLASWGEIAVGEVRRTASYPSRSAIMGLLSAACGIKRNETEQLSSLFSGYDIAVKVLSPGSLLKDFHTIQAPRYNKKLFYSTRRDEIIMGKELLGTILSTREYRCDSLSIVSIRPRDNPPYSLSELINKLLNPKYILYLGRKSCPISVPLKPQIVSAIGFKESFYNSSFPPLVVSSKGKDITNYYIGSYTIKYFWEGDAIDMEPQQTYERYDEPKNRLRWQFSPRLEHSMVERGD